MSARNRRTHIYTCTRAHVTSQIERTRSRAYRYIGRYTSTYTRENKRRASTYGRRARARERRSTDFSPFFSALLLLPPPIYIRHPPSRHIHTLYTCIYPARSICRLFSSMHALHPVMISVFGAYYIHSRENRFSSYFCLRISAARPIGAELFFSPRARYTLEPVIRHLAYTYSARRFRSI